MIIDALTFLWNAAALTATAVSDFCYDTGGPPVTGAPINDLGTGKPLCFAIAITVAPNTATGDETYEFDMITSTVGDLATGLKTVAAYKWTNAQAAASLLAGTLLVIPFPPMNSQVQRYIGLKYISAGTLPSMTVTAWISTMDMINTYRALGTAIIVL